MPNEILVKPKTAITFTDATGDVAITLANLGAGAGRVSAEYDKGSGAQEAWYHVHASVEFETAPAAGELVEVYVISHDGTNIPGNVGAVDAAVTVANKKLNMGVAPVVIVAEAGTADLAFKAAGVVYCPLRYISVLVWNGSAADNLQNTANVNKVVITPLVDEVQ